jgi:CRISPR system Cascade subunit CasC
MLIELHLLQNFVPSCLNRDDTNTPKECTFGGHRRARISSQCIKRSVRKYFGEAKLLATQNLAERSKRLLGEVVKLLVAQGHAASEAEKVVETALGAVKIKAENKETQYLLFLGRGEIQNLANVIHTHWDALKNALPAAAPAPPSGEKPARKSTRQEKNAAKEAVPLEVAKEVKAALDGGKAADLALFGRMLADQADLNVQAACQVAHALSTNKIGSMEMDFYTAVDDLKEREADPGAGMMGTVEFNSSCFYRYANIDFDQLTENLHQDVELARAAVKAFLQASIHAIPTGKQNSMAAHNMPALVFAVVRERGPMNLANAFEGPIAPDHNGTLVGKSIGALDTYWGRIGRMYGNGAKVAKLCIEHDDLALAHLDGAKVSNVASVIDGVMEALPTGKGAV